MERVTSYSLDMSISAASFAIEVSSPSPSLQTLMLLAGGWTFALCKRKQNPSGPNADEEEATAG
eukprot:767924-Hanusia_phi.AAC.4